jgi:hypothetical protein
MRDDKHRERKRTEPFHAFPVIFLLIVRCGSNMPFGLVFVTWSFAQIAAACAALVLQRKQRFRRATPQLRPLEGGCGISLFRSLGDFFNLFPIRCVPDQRSLHIG